MKIRQAKKICKSETVKETNPKCRVYWYRYYKASNTINRITSKLINKQKRNGKTFLNDEKIDDIVSNVMKEYYE